ncbi:adenine phosphoribosyltransferase [Nesterenkonia aurantiaca]|uniref:adenine phosphoribosyltransferase n=1 Tax=Nesterenkonia aurantiaca TaxID=1436010 RepID=UPI003EE4A03F
MFPPPSPQQSTPSPERLAHAQSLFAVTPDFPEPGVLFQDISPVLADPAALRTVAEGLLAPFAGSFDMVAGIEARGFTLAGMIAALTGTGFMPIRKAGKLPAPAGRVEYTLEYGTAVIEAPDVLKPEHRVLIVDDVLATGGTLAATRELIAQLDCQVAGAAVVLEIEALGGRELCGQVHALFQG